MGIAVVGLCGLLLGVVMTSDSDEVSSGAPRSTTTASTTSSSTSTTTSTIDTRPKSPLTGLPVDEEVLGRPAVVVKIDNIDGSARPPAGVRQADVVFEEKVEGPFTRLAAVFHSADSVEIGPIRSARSTDVTLTAMLNRPVFSFSGANTVFRELVQQANVVDLGYDVHSEYYYRRADRVGPNDIFGQLDRIREGQGDAGVPVPLFAYRADPIGDPDAPEPPGSLPATSILFNFGAQGTQGTFTWDPDTTAWLRTQGGTPHVDEAGDQLSPTNVIIQFVDYIDTGLVDPAGAAVPEATLLGSGEAWVFTDGRVQVGRWERPALGDVTRYVDSSSTPVLVMPGQTWVMLANSNGQFAWG